MSYHLVEPVFEAIQYTGSNASAVATFFTTNNTLVGATCTQDENGGILTLTFSNPLNPTRTLNTNDYLVYGNANRFWGETAANFAANYVSF